LYLGAKKAFVNGPRWVKMRTHWPLAMSHTRALPSSEPVLCVEKRFFCFSNQIFLVFDRVSLTA
jgi:hypothetical protein